jgi:CO/xanthine dehydrogenase FAD-binding subunit
MWQLRNAKILKVSDLGIHECRSNMNIKGIVCKDLDSSNNKRLVVGALVHNNKSADSIRDMEFS